jgi:hypothetical protein
MHVSYDPHPLYNVFLDGPNLSTLTVRKTSNCDVKMLPALNGWAHHPSAAMPSVTVHLLSFYDST